MVIIKPNAMKKRAAGIIIQKFQDQGLLLSGLKLIQISPALCEKFYREHREKPFFQELSRFMCSFPTAVMALSGPDAVSSVRSLMGDTDPKKALPGTLRFKYGDNIGENGLHGSDSLENARRELALFFAPEELLHPSL